MKTETNAVDINRNIGDFHYKVDYAKDAGSGLSEKTIHYISDVKEDPDWVREFRLRGLKTFLEKPLPTHWASKDLEAIDFDKIRYYLASDDAFNYSPPGVQVKDPLQAELRIKAEKFEQFERTLILPDGGSEVTYIDVCNPPKFKTTALHSTLVEHVRLKRAKTQDITVQSWS